MNRPLICTIGHCTTVKTIDLFNQFHQFPISSPLTAPIYICNSDIQLIPYTPIHGSFGETHFSFKLNAHFPTGGERCSESGRAILASPGDGELLSFYGKLIWETEKDEMIVKSYFDQAVSASPDDCMVLGSYAQFMWEAEDDDEEEVMVSGMGKAAMVETF